MMESDRVKNIVGPTILLHGGEYFDFVDPEASAFTILDIAHGLSNICRFTGQCRKFYSVAEHSVMASRLIEPEFAFEALMHDAAEAFVGDVSSPLKGLLRDYRVIEARVNAAICRRFGLPPILSDAVKRVDLAMLKTEQAQLMRNRDNWPMLSGFEAFAIELPCWTPEVAEAMFLQRVEELRPATNALRSDGGSP